MIAWREHKFIHSLHFSKELFGLKTNKKLKRTEVGKVLFISYPKKREKFLSHEWPISINSRESIIVKELLLAVKEKDVVVSIPIGLINWAPASSRWDKPDSPFVFHSFPNSSSSKLLPRGILSSHKNTVSQKASVTDTTTTLKSFLLTTAVNWARSVRRLFYKFNLSVFFTCTGRGSIIN